MKPARMTFRGAKRWLGLIILSAGLVHNGAGPSATPGALPYAWGAPVPAPKVELKAVKYADLARAVTSRRGQVVVVDIWGDFCEPCKQAFPHLVHLHEKYAKDGLVCMSVSVDQEEARANALAFLVKQKATFPNFWLDEPRDVWQEKWNMNGPPALFVFDRQGRRAAKFDSNDPRKTYTPAQVEKLVLELLRASP
jgi:thiol-disulfide isomerase/thioredoxin